jgi:hypothetical protein
MRPRTIFLAAITALSTAGLFSNQAAAMPAANLAAATSEVSISQNVAWVCGPFRCWWAPRRYYAPRVVVVPRAYYGYAPAYYGYAPTYGYGAGYGWGYGPRFGYRVVGPGRYGYRRGLYRRRW